MKKNAGNMVSWGSVLVVFIGIHIGNPKLIVFCILIAAFMDMFDGKLARKYGDNTKCSQTFGELTDSLCDVINFGIAPSLILSMIIFEDNFSFLLLVSSFLFTLGGIYRLARFSAYKDRPKVQFYQGVPITIAGPLLAVISILSLNEYVIIIVSLILCGLMVSKLKIKKI
ncbi:MAG: CDP-alcohol phosphatidyltransferase family protein [Mycoplasmatales bacterium]